MNLLEYRTTIEEALEKLVFESTYIPNGGAKPYSVTSLNKLRSAIVALRDVPYIKKEISELTDSWLFKNQVDSAVITNDENSVTGRQIRDLKIRLDFLLGMIYDSGMNGREDVLYIKLPQISGFETLERFSNDLKKAIEIPIIDPVIKGSVEIVGAEQGSIILYVAVGSIAAINLIAGICWSALLMKKKYAEAKIFEAHAKTLELKNESLENLVAAQKAQLKNILDSEAEAIANKHYSHNDPETIERLKLSISTVAELVEKGTKILPMNKSEEIQKAFPNYNATNLIESTIKQLKEGN